MAGATAALIGGAAGAPAAVAADDYSCNQTTCVFQFTATRTAFVVPAGVSTITGVVGGAQGGGSFGGRGAHVRFILDVKAGDQLTGLVGKTGDAVKPSENGTGGEASLLAKNGTVVLVAGGGGGGASDLRGGNGGGVGACQAGSPGESSGGTPPTGGTATSAGTGGVGTGATGGPGGGPASASRPASGGAATTIPSSPYNGGGGGGGYYGGGAGGSAPATGGAYQAGAGGSGYMAAGQGISQTGITECQSVALPVPGRVDLNFPVPTDVDVPAVHPYMAIGGVAAAGLTGAAFWLRRRTARGRAAAS